MAVRASIALLYALAVALLVSRMEIHAAAARHIPSTLANAGGDYPSLVTPLFTNLRGGLLILGSIAAFAFILYAHFFTTASQPPPDDAGQQSAAADSS